VDDQKQPRWRPTREQLLWIGAAVVLLTVAVLVGYRYDITLWDWLKLLMVPAVIVGGGLWFNRQQRERELGLAREQREQELTIAREQREQELAIAEQRTQDEALQAYLDQMSSMLIPNTDQPSLYKARPGDSLSSVARARTLTVLPRLDGERKARVVQFLYEAGLIAKNHPTVAMRGADLREVNLRGGDLRGAQLSEANLSNADLMEANLRGADLSRAILREADLSLAFLIAAILSRADLRGADLRGAQLSNADLRGADLTQARDWTEEQLREARSLEGATMPNGQKYEEWLKSKGHGENGKNSALP
jgi:uncharacterized protein YjbI with pentapeptide repeats